MSPRKTISGLFQPRGKSARLVSARHINPLFEVKNRCARRSSQMTQKSIQALTFSGCDEKSSAGFVQAFGLERLVEVEKAGCNPGVRVASLICKIMNHFFCGLKKKTCGAQK